MSLSNTFKRLVHIIMCNIIIIILYNMSSTITLDILLEVQQLIHYNKVAMLQKVHNFIMQSYKVYA